MPDPDLLIYTAHGLFWSAFGVTLVLLRAIYGREPATEREPSMEREASAERSGDTHTARYSRALIAFHSIAFGVMYFGIALAVFGHRVPRWFQGQRAAGAVVIAI